MCDYSTSDEVFDMQEEEDIMIILALHKNKRLKHDRSVFRQERLMQAQIEGGHQ
jgi:hypothetical protein